MPSEREKSDKRERAIAHEEGGRRVAGSGSTPFQKEDVTFKGVLMQDKRTASQSLSIKALDLKKLEYHAMNAGKVGVLSFAFDGTDLEFYCFPAWFVKNQNWWQELKRGQDESQ